MTEHGQQELTEEAVRLLGALHSRVALAPPSERLPGLTLDAAYEIQRQMIGRRMAAGAVRVGRKVGLTSKAMQEMLGVDQPDHGVLLDDMVVEESAGIERASLIAPRVEAEIAFVLGAPLEGDVQAADVLAATRSVRAALEIIDSRVVDWRIGIVDTVADNASSALVILGAERPVAAVDLISETATVTVGGASETGSGAAVLGDPAEAVAWLARTLSGYGERLEAGEIVLPGAMARALPFASGDLVRASFASLGEIEVAIR